MAAYLVPNQDLVPSYVTWTRVRVSDTDVDPRIRYVIFRILGYKDTVLVLDTGTGIPKN